MAQHLLFSAFFILILFCWGCDPGVDPMPICVEVEPAPAIRAVDMSLLPKLEAAGAVYRDTSGQVGDALEILRGAGVNTIRIRVLYQPGALHPQAGEVLALVGRCRQLGLGVWLTVFYSDTWADPGQQAVPAAWEGLSQAALADSVYAYTARIVHAYSPDFVQIGNEINHGFLWPQGQGSGLIPLLQEGIRAVRDQSDSTKVMLHFAGLDGAMAFFQELSSLDYDIAGISYYPWWHGKVIDDLTWTLGALKTETGRPVLVAETAYPFTLGWEDQTHNAVGLEEHLILPQYPATPKGQQDYLERIRQAAGASGAAGYCYWGGEWISAPGLGSSWENLALFDFSGNFLRAGGAFRGD